MFEAVQNAGDFGTEPTRVQKPQSRLAGWNQSLDFSRGPFRTRMGSSLVPIV